MSLNTLCPLCQQGTAAFYCEDKQRSYLQCEYCCLVFVSAHERLNSHDEKAIFDLHQNSEHDGAYRQFLSRLFDPLTQRLPAASKGLDFGCGPGPALAAMFRESGFNIDLYDIFYHDDQHLLQQRYDFITATEVAVSYTHLTLPTIYSV